MSRALSRRLMRTSSIVFFSGAEANARPRRKPARGGANSPGRKCIRRDVLIDVNGAESGNCAAPHSSLTRPLPPVVVPASWPRTAASSSAEKTRSMSRIMMNCVSRLPMPRMKSVRIWVPMRGAGSICSGSRSITSSTESASAPITIDSLSSSTSTTTMQVLRVFSVFDIPKHSRRSTTGTTLPRRLMTPAMNSGVLGIAVMGVRSSTSLTFATSVAKTSLPSLKVRYCRVSVISLTLMLQLLSHPEDWGGSPGPPGAELSAPWRSVTLEFSVQFVVLIVEPQVDPAFALLSLPRERGHSA